MSGKWGAIAGGSGLKVRVDQSQKLEAQTLGLQRALTSRVVNDPSDRRGKHPRGNARASGGSAARVHPDDRLVALMQLGREPVMEDARLP